MGSFESPTDRIVVGTEVDAMDDGALAFPENVLERFENELERPTPVGTTRI